MSDPEKMPPTLRLNDATVPCPQGMTLTDLLTAHDMAPDQVATAVNGTFVPRPMRRHHTLQPGDTVLTFQAIVGG